MQYNDLLVYDPGNQYPKEPTEIAPFATIPSWWRGFIFHVLRPREFSVYMFLAMKSDGQHAVMYPRGEEIRAAMGMKSDSQIYEAVSSLEKLGFIRKRVLTLPNRTLRFPRNVYQRAAPEFTLLELLKRTDPSNSEGRNGDKGIDELIRPGTWPAPVPEFGVINLPPNDVIPGLKRLLGEEYIDYSTTPDTDKREVLNGLLQERLDRRRRQGGERYANRQAAPRDRQREDARDRELAHAAAGGVATSQAYGDDLDDTIPF